MTDEKRAGRSRVLILLSVPGDTELKLCVYKICRNL